MSRIGSVLFPITYEVAPREKSGVEGARGKKKASAKSEGF
jgi:hypothetical protein